MNLPAMIPLATTTTGARGLTGIARIVGTSCCWAWVLKGLVKKGPSRELCLTDWGPCWESGLTESQDQLCSLSMQVLEMVGNDCPHLSWWSSGHLGAKRIVAIRLLVFGKKRSSIRIPCLALTKRKEKENKKRKRENEKEKSKKKIKGKKRKGKEKKEKRKVCLSFLPLFYFLSTFLIYLIFLSIRVLRS